MAKVYDILLDDNMDLRIENGDFVIGESTEQNQQLILLAEKGSFVASPLRGVGIQSWLNEDSGVDELKHAIQSEIEADGMKVEQLSITNTDSISLIAGYE